MNLARLKRRTVAKFLTRYPSLAGIFSELFHAVESTDIPWIPVTKLLSDSKVALVTTGGIHQRDQVPFDMDDPQGDATFREIDAERPLSDLMITHDYYDHSDADKDLNILFPIERLRELASEGFIGQLAEKHYGFMGHIKGIHVQTLIHDTSREVAKRLKENNVDVVLLTPG